MEKLVPLGLTRSIGISNFNSEQIDRILSVATIKPTVNQVECSPQVNQNKLIDFCKKRDIVVTGYTPLGRPNFEKKTPKYIFDSKMEEIGKKYNKTTAQIALNYLVGFLKFDSVTLVIMLIFCCSVKLKLIQYQNQQQNQELNKILIFLILL